MGRGVNVREDFLVVAVMEAGTRWPRIQQRGAWVHDRCAYT
jgi:hypothetical protein